ncbi:Hypothetical protein GLP15_1983 [Giardia lamblia P15]|uniref:Uncharacterized protein n=1 Tax=Giardia intestinalis (strain P15) TaxID=658858 RepID=E1F147_GIAIA|nr:Hypothetical protein GLP15_1983 [Giardia lamblia P15]
MFSKSIKKPSKAPSITSSLPVLPMVEVDAETYGRAKRMIFLHNECRLVLSQDPENFPLHTSSILLYLTSSFLVKSAIYDTAVLLSNALRVPIIALIENPGPCYHRLYRFLYGTYRIISIGINTYKTAYQPKDLIAHFNVYFSANIVLTEYFPIVIKNEYQLLTPAHELSLTFSLLSRKVGVFYMCPYPLRLRTGPLRVAQLSSSGGSWDVRSQAVPQQGTPPDPVFISATKRLPSHNVNYPQYPWISPLISTYILVYDTGPKNEKYKINLSSRLKDCMELWLVENASCLIREIHYSTDIYSMLRGILLLMIVNSGLSTYHTFLHPSTKQYPVGSPVHTSQKQKKWKDMDAQFEALSLVLETTDKSVDHFVGKTPQAFSESLTYTCSDLLNQLTSDSGQETISHVTIATYLGYISLEAFLSFLSIQKASVARRQDGQEQDREDTFTKIYIFALRDTKSSNKTEEENVITPQYLLWMLYNSHVRKLYSEMLHSLDITLCPVVSQGRLTNFSEKILTVLQIQLLFALCSPSSFDQYLLFVFRISFQYARPELISPMPLVSRQYLAYDLTIVDIIAILSPIYRKLVYLYALRYIERAIFNVYGKNVSRDASRQPVGLLPDSRNVSNQIHPGQG